ncbi:MAG: aldo/keto reductase [Deltaproteobacteria bacterium]|nr:MAG: aldo/keto reductase [Deltaproteobacteria bacterium]
MKYFTLGRTGINVSELCFGALPMGPLQKKMAPDAGAEIILKALAGGVNFIDTAQLYQTYEPIRLALKKATSRPVIVSKSMALDAKGMQTAVAECLEALELDYIDIFHLHAARVPGGEDVFQKRAGAWQVLLDYKEKGIIKAVGISTHSVPAVLLAAENDEVDVVFPIINKTGTGILHGTLAEMETAINLCRQKNKGLYLMKALGGGCLVKDFHAALKFVRDKFPLPIAMGMVNSGEVEYNLAYFNTTENELGSLPELVIEEKCFQIVDFICKDCGECIETCPNLAISRISEESKPAINPDLCLRCGYCVGFCPQFAIRMT